MSSGRRARRRSISPLVDKLTRENAVAKRLKFAAQPERFGGEERSHLGEGLDADLQARPRQSSSWRRR